MPASSVQYPIDRRPCIAMASAVQSAGSKGSFPRRFPPRYPHNRPGNARIERLDRPVSATESGGSVVNQGSSGGSDCRNAGTVGARLRCFRARRLWTQATLAERAGLPEKTISSLETGARRKPHLTTLELLADALELDAADRDALRASRDARSPTDHPPQPLLPLP